jgi:hypothetical protein
MKHLAAGRLLAGMCLSFASIQAQAADAPGFYAGNADQLHGVPIHVVVLNSELRTQLPYGASTYDPHLSSTLANSISSNLWGMPGMSFGEVVGVGVAGGLIAAAIISAAEKQAAKSLVEAAHATLQQARCDLPGGQDLARVITEAAANAPWTGEGVPRSAVLGAKQDVKDVVDSSTRRHVLVATYSMTPDFSTVISSLIVDTYADGFEDADRRWASRPLRSDRLLVFSDQVTIPDKSADDIETGVALEKERYAAGPAGALIAQANRGDTQARKRAAPLVREHDRRMREARAPGWTPAEAAARRSALWVADDCQLLASSLDANHEELRGLLTSLYGAGLPVAEPREKGDPPVNIMAALPSEEPGIRKTLALPDNVWLSRRGGDYATLLHLYTWYTP